MKMFKIKSQMMYNRDEMIRTKETYKIGTTIYCDYNLFVFGICDGEMCINIEIDNDTIRNLTTGFSSTTNQSINSSVFNR